MKELDSNRNALGWFDSRWWFKLKIISNEGMIAAEVTTVQT